MSIRSMILAFTSLGLVSAAWAGNTGPFIEKKGVVEFTGTMIVRPMQPEALAQKGYAPIDIAKIHTRAVARLHDLQLRSHPEIDTFVVSVPHGSTENVYAKQMMQTGDYEYVTPNWRVFTQAKVTPNDPRFPTQWHHKVIHSEEAWGISTGSSSITVAIVDTGVMTTHEDLKAGIVKGYNAIDRKPEVNGGDVSDQHGHGTHCAGDAAAQGNNGVGLVGEGWKFKIMPVKASANGSASFDDLMDGVRWAATHGAKVVSVSFSGVDTPLIGTTGTFVKAQGSLMLYAAGNDDRDLSGFSYPDVIVVGASDEQDHKASFSAFGKGVSVFAPGTNIWSTTNDGSYQPFSGTSMATPVTNGACALIWSINPALTPNEVQQILYKSCDPIGPSATFGHGRINLFKAAQAANATKYLDAIFNATAVKTIIGKYKTGSLNNIITGGGVGYQTNSAFDPNTGYSTGVELTYKVTRPLDKIRTLNPVFRVSTTGGVTLIAMIYMFDLNTQRYTLVKTASLPINGATTLIQAPMSGGFGSYMASNGNTRALLRVFSPIGRRGAVGGSFVSNIRFSQLKSTYQN